MNLFHSACALSLFALLHVPVHAASRASPPSPAAKLDVVCTLPDLADITRAIGGERVSVTTLYKGRENTHALIARPSHLVAMSRADMFVQVGLSLESSIVPGLLENCRNDKIAPGRPGFVNVSEGWSAIQVPVALSRQHGDVHPHGNPHMNLDPRAGRHAAKIVHAHIVRVDPGSEAGYDERYAAWLVKLTAADERWAAAGKPWEGLRIVTYHKEFDYLAVHYGIAIQGTVESKPGVPPTPNHVAALIETMKREPGAVIVTAPWSNNDTVARIADETGAKVVELPNMCGGIAGTETWIDMMDLVHERLAAAFGTAQAPR